MVMTIYSAHGESLQAFRIRQGTPEEKEDAAGTELEKHPD